MANERYKYNKKLLDIISRAIEKYTDLRFIQLLWKLNIVNNEDRFYEESKETYNLAKNGGTND